MKALLLPALAFALTACATAPQAPSAPTAPRVVYPDPRTYFLGQSLEKVVSEYGVPDSQSAVGETVLMRFTGYGRRGPGFDNICSLTLQADKASGIIKKADIGSNLWIEPRRWPIDVRQDCNRVFYRPSLAPAITSSGG